MRFASITFDERKLRSSHVTIRLTVKDLRVKMLRSVLHIESSNFKKLIISSLKENYVV
jgi:hypothetical protein